MNLDFFKIQHRIIPKKNDTYVEVYPEFLVKPSEHLMTRGGKFYAVLNLENGFWEMDEFKIQEYVDKAMREYAETNKDIVNLKQDDPKHCKIVIKEMVNNRSRSWIEYKTYVSNLPDHYHQLDDKICFDEDKVNPKDYISKKLSYKLVPGSFAAWDKLAGTLYSPSEREKIEWAIGSIISGDSKTIQKFVVLYGAPGAGKGTILNIIQKLFPGYYEVFDAKTISSNSNNFALEQFRSNPLIALQMDGDLSKIEDNTKLNSLVSHETVLMNEKRKQSYNFKPRCFLFMASNKPVQITDSKSGLLRRLIDVTPTGITIPKKEYDQLMNQIDFELSGTAYHCLEVFRKLGKNAYNGYKPFDMIERTNPVYNFVLDRFDLLNREEGIFIGEAFNEWETYCKEIGMTNYMRRPAFKEELKSYFVKFDEYKKTSDGNTCRGWYTQIDTQKLKSGYTGQKVIPHNDKTFGLVLDQKKSLLDEILKDCQAQYGEEKPEGGSKPVISWSNCRTTLKDIDTSRLHFVRPPKNHIVIDFDLKNERGEKDALLNLEAAEKFPRTYAEYSQGGKGLHLHYIYDGDPEELSSIYAKDIEIKVFTGKSSLRRRLSLCNNIPVATISCGLPKKEVSEAVDFDSVKNELHIRNIVAKCLKKEIAQPYTAPAMSLIKKTLDDAYKAGIPYDIRDMRPAISGFASKSHHQKDVCQKIANDLHYCSKDHEETTPSTKVEAQRDSLKDIREILSSTKQPEIEITIDQKDLDAVCSESSNFGTKQLKVETKPIPEYSDEEIVFFDIEVFPNLFLVNWKTPSMEGCTRMINPTRAEIGELLKRKLVGFNCRRYDNHILYARYIGYDLDAIYRLSQRIIGGSKNAMFGNAYDISYTDVYDFAAKKQSLKKWEIELGIHHKELGLPWDQPVDPNRWKEVAEYCDNDVIATEAVFNELAGDFKAREILADIAGMKVNDTTNQLTTRIIFGDDPKPQAQFNYPNLAEKFPGYRFEAGKSYFRHEIKIPKKADIGKAYEYLNRIYEKRLISFDVENRIAVVDEEIGEGGRVYAVPGVHYKVFTFDVASMHPHSIIAENGFGKYTERFKQLLDIRIAIKHKDFEKARTMLDGKLAKYLDDPTQAKALSQALKIAINSVYGLTAAGFENKFRDPRNKDNWVAKRGALFIETLRLAVTEMGGKVVHIKTDSIKVIDPSEKISKFIMDYGAKWGYTFEIEDIYEKMCLVNDAVYIALRDKTDPGWTDECEKAKKKAEANKTVYIEPTRWSATGAQFAHPYVFKTLFSHEPVEFRDLCETKTVTSALYLDFNENLSDVSAYEKDLEKLTKKVKDLLKKGIGLDVTIEDFRRMFASDNKERPEIPAEKEILYEQALDQLKDIDILNEMIAKGHNYQFVGKAGSFCPVKAGTGGGILCREKDGKFSAATGSKGHRWREGETLEGADRMDLIDMAYFEGLAETARNAVEEYAVKAGSSFERFASEREPEEKEQAPSFISIDEMLDESDKAFGKKPAWEEPPFDDESIAKMEDELRKAVENYENVKA